MSNGFAGGEAQSADLRGLKLRQASVLGGVHPQEPRPQDLQRVPMGDQKDVAARVAPFQIRDEGGRPVKHGGRRLDVAIGIAGVGRISRPDPRIVAGR